MLKVTRKIALLPLLFWVGFAVAAGILGTLYTARIQFNSSLAAVTGSSDQVDRALASIQAFREQTLNKSAIPSKAFFKVKYVDGSEEMAQITSALFSEPLVLVPNTLRLPNSGLISPSPNINFGNYSVNYVLTGHWVSGYTCSDTCSYAGSEFVVDSITSNAGVLAMNASVKGQAH
jgi:hypothetical protein